MYVFLHAQLEGASSTFSASASDCDVEKYVWHVKIRKGRGWWEGQGNGGWRGGRGGGGRGGGTYICTCSSHLDVPHGSEDWDIFLTEILKNLFLLIKDWNLHIQYNKQTLHTHSIHTLSSSVYTCCLNVHVPSLPKWTEVYFRLDLETTIVQSPSDFFQEVQGRNCPL